MNLALYRLETQDGGGSEVYSIPMISSLSIKEILQVKSFSREIPSTEYCSNSLVEDSLEETQLS